MTPFDRRRFMATATGAGLTLSAQYKANAGERAKPNTLPNILCFVSEDNTTLLGAYGDKLVHTPNLDQLAARGIVFDNAFATSPVCGPSRFSIISGLYPATAGPTQSMGSDDAVLPRRFVTTPTPLRALGYYCTNNQKKNYVSQLDFLDIWDETGRTAHWNNKPAGAPFFAIFNTFTTHESALFSPLDGKVKPEEAPIPPYLPDTPGIRRDVATYYNAMEKMDGEFAARLAEVDAAGLTDDTIVIYYSDHGGIMPRGKRYANNYGLRVPLIIYAPPKYGHLIDAEPGSRISAPANLIDMTPTIFSLAGLKPPDYMQGRALVGPHKARPAVYAFGGRNRMDERFDFVRTVADTRYRYTRNYMPHRPGIQHVTFSWQARSFQDWEAAYLAGSLNDIQRQPWERREYEQLFDVDADPYNLTNLIDDPALQKKRAELSHALDKHMIEVNDNGFIPEGLPLQGYRESRWNGAYPLREIMAAADRAARNDAGNIPEFLTLLNHDHDVMRYWGAQGLLILGNAASSQVDAIKAAFGMEQCVPARISLAETLVGLSEDLDALRELGRILDMEDDGPFRLYAINALTYLGEKARPVLPAIRRSATGDDHQHVRNAAIHLVDLLEGTYDPHNPRFMRGGVFPDPERESEMDVRIYD